MAFGIASRLPREQAGAPASETIAGTLAYMAPNRPANEPLDGDRTDLYALGITFYEMLTGLAAIRRRRTDGVGALPHHPTAHATQPKGEAFPFASK